MMYPEAEKEQNIYQAKQLSLSLLYWLQTEAPGPMVAKDIQG